MQVHAKLWGLCWVLCNPIQMARFFLDTGGIFVVSVLPLRQASSFVAWLYIATMEFTLWASFLTNQSALYRLAETWNTKNTSWGCESGALAGACNWRNHKRHELVFSAAWESTKVCLDIHTCSVTVSQDCLLLGVAIIALSKLCRYGI